MNKKTIITAMLLAALSLSACGSSKKATSKDFVSITTETTAGEVTKNMNLKNFHAISCTGIADIYYTQKGQYQVKLVGSKGLVNSYNCYVEGNTLNIEVKNNRYSNNGKMRIYVTAPYLSDLSSTGMITFTSDGISVKNFQIDVSGTSKINIKKVDCNRFKLDQSGLGKYQGDIVARYVDIENMGTSTFEGDIDGGTVKIDNTGMCKYKGKITASDIDIDNGGTGNCDATINCGTLNVDNIGMGSMNLKCTASSITLDNAGSAKIDINVKTSSLSLSNEGLGRITASGEAGETTIEGEAKDKIDTSALKKY